MYFKIHHILNIMTYHNHHFYHIQTTSKKDSHNICISTQFNHVLFLDIIYYITETESKKLKERF